MKLRYVVSGFLCAALVLTALPGCDKAVDIIGGIFGDDDDTTVTYDVSTASLEQTLTFFSSGSNDVDYGQLADAIIDPNGQRIVAVNTDGLVRIWRRYDSRLLGSFSTGDTESNGLVSISPDGARLVTRHESSVKVWDLESGNLIQNHLISQNVRDVAVSADWTRLAIGKTENATHRVDIFDLGTGATLRRITLQDGNGDDWVDGNVESIVLNEDGSQVLVGAHNDTTALILDTSTGETIRSLNVRLPTVTYSTEVALTRDGSRAAAISEYDYLLTVWDLTGDGDVVSQAWAESLVGMPQTLVQSPDGRYVIAASAKEIAATHHQILPESHPFLGIWDMETGVQVCELLTSPNGASKVSLSQNGRRFISIGVDQSISVWVSGVASTAGD